MLGARLGKFGNDNFGALFGRRMAAWRAELRLTQGQLAALVWPGDSNAEVTRKGDISRLESGMVANPQAQTVLRIARALEIEGEIDALRKAAQMTAAQQLEVIPTLSRDQLELLASRFGITAPHDRSDADLRGLLTEKAAEFRALQAQIDALLAKFPQLGNVVAEAQVRLESGDADGVRQMVRDARQVLHDARLREALEQDAELVELDAAALLLDNRVDEALAQLSAAADSFAAVNPLEPALRRLDYADRLYQHGLRMGGAGLERAARMNADALTRLDRATHPWEWARGQNNLAAALQQQGTRTAGPEGAALLEQAVAAFRAALEVYTRQAHPVDWAMTQANLAIAHQALANHDTCTDPKPLLRAALAHVEAALEVFDPVHMPYDHGTAITLRDEILSALG